MPSLRSTALTRSPRRHAGDPELPGVVPAAVQFHVFSIGEAVKALPSTVTSRRPDVPWSDVARMRDLIGHHYYRLDQQIVRATIGEPLARLRVACEALLAQETGQPPTGG